MNILAIIVAYNPDRDLLERNIASFAPYVSKILIWRNSLFDLSDIYPYGLSVEVGMWLLVRLRSAVTGPMQVLARL